MTTANFLCDSVCSTCGKARFKIISDGLAIAAPVIKDKVLKCFGCGSCKVAGLAYDEIHSRYHDEGSDPSGQPFHAELKL